MVVLTCVCWLVGWLVGWLVVDVVVLLLLLTCVCCSLLCSFSLGGLPLFLFIINKIDALQFMCPLAISVRKRQRKSALQNDKTKRSDCSSKKQKTKKQKQKLLCA